jgi:hypothetical protein
MSFFFVQGYPARCRQQLKRGQGKSYQGHCHESFAVRATYGRFTRQNVGIYHEESRVRYAADENRDVRLNEKRWGKFVSSN